MYASFPKGDYSAFDPNSKITFLIMWLLSIEPPIYAVLNEAIRIRSLALLPMVGPLAAGLAVVLTNCEKYRADAIVPGYETLKLNPEHELGCFCESFLLFSGA